MADSVTHGTKKRQKSLLTFNSTFLKRFCSFHNLILFLFLDRILIAFYFFKLFRFSSFHNLTSMYLYMLKLLLEALDLTVEVMCFHPP